MSGGSDILGTIKGTTVDSHYGIFKSGTLRFNVTSLLHFPLGSCRAAVDACHLQAYILARFCVPSAHRTRLVVKPTSSDEIDKFAEYFSKCTTD